MPPGWGVGTWLWKEREGALLVKAKARVVCDDEDAQPSQDKLRRKGIIQPPGNRPGRVQEDKDGMGFFHRSTPVGFEGTS